MVRGIPEILLVEDNPDDVFLTKKALKRNGLRHEVAIARDGEEALCRLLGPGGSDAPTLVLLDLRLPKVDGLEVLERLRAEERTRHLPVALLICSQSEAATVSSRGGRLADLCLEKAVRFERFVYEVGRLRLLLDAGGLRGEPPRARRHGRRGPATAG